MASISQSHRSEFQIEFDEKGSLTRRKTQFLPDGVYSFEDQLDVAGVLKATLITCRAWLIELYELRAGELYFIRGKDEVRPETKRFGVFYSPFSITLPCFSNARGNLLGLAALESMPEGIPALPTLFEISDSRFPANLAEVVEILRAPDRPQTIESNPNPSLLSLKAKRLIVENYLAYPSISRIAKRLRVTHEHLSRQFKRDFGMSPGNYLRQLRVADAPLRLAKGEEIVNVSQDVGYNDLSRFYKQFRKTTEKSPGVCKRILRPREK
jgi:AraC-like DNA-binding protein